jgi:hypothetical protein
MLEGMNRADKLFEEIQNLPRADRLRLAERVIREAARERETSDTQQLIADLQKDGVITPAAVTDATPPPRAPVAPVRILLDELRADRDGR